MATVDMICSVHRWKTTGHSVDQKMFEWKVVSYISNITSLLWLCIVYDRWRVLVVLVTGDTESTRDNLQKLDL